MSAIARKPRPAGEIVVWFQARAVRRRRRGRVLIETDRVKMLALRRRFPEIGVLVLSHYLESRYAMSLVEEFPERSGYLLKDRVSDIGVLTDALRRIAEGECVFVCRRRGWRLFGEQVPGGLVGDGSPVALARDRGVPDLGVASVVQHPRRADQHVGYPGSWRRG